MLGGELVTAALSSISVRAQNFAQAAGPVTKSCARAAAAVISPAHHQANSFLTTGTWREYRILLVTYKKKKPFFMPSNYCFEIGKKRIKL